MLSILWNSKLQFEESVKTFQPLWILVSSFENLKHLNLFTFLQSEDWVLGEIIVRYEIIFQLMINYVEIHDVVSPENTREHNNQRCLLHKRKCSNLGEEKNSLWFKINTILFPDWHILPSIHNSDIYLLIHPSVSLSFLCFCLLRLSNLFIRREERWGEACLATN